MNSSRRWVVMMSGALFCLPAAGGAQQTPPAPRPDCTSKEHRAFDFWLGKWEVTAGGQRAGSNEITLAQQGCILHEHWTGAGGGSGESFNFYDRTTGQWNQVWIDAQGNVLRLSGHHAPGEMRLTGTTLRGGRTIMQKLTFFENPDGTVRQLWESSPDEGTTWNVVFDGLYRRQPD